jgi:hypothetical protein
MVSVLNIAAEKHDPEHYINILRTTQALGRYANYRGPRVAKLAPFVEFNDKATLAGGLITYIKPDPNETWYDESKDQIVSDDDAAGGSIPFGVHPGYRRSDFFLTLKGICFFLRL